MCWRRDPHPRSARALRFEGSGGRGPPRTLHIGKSVRRQEYNPGLCTVVSQRSRGGIYSVDGAEGTAVCPVPLHQVCVIL